jgi:NTP pyrophosphatase (non-canonical NTP hydrolase)
VKGGAAFDVRPTIRALDLVWEERRRQRDRWGGRSGDGVENPTMPDPVRLRVLVEEVGEVAEAMGRPEDGNGTRDLRTELVQVAAVAVAWIEALDVEPVE